ncbi:MAG: hypothetical protein ACREQ4_07705 [Candidatus Binataceae bacterium]
MDLKSKWSSILCGSLAAMMLSGCATIFSGGPQSLDLTSTPPGATYQYGPYTGKTPDTLQASRGSLAHVATFQLAGYESKTVPVEMGVQGVTWVDILFWPGFIVDFVTGNAYKVTTPNIAATLTPVATSSSAPASPVMPLAAAKQP